MKTINLYLDFEFTSLSPDAQPISLGIVSDKIISNVPVDEIREFDNGSLRLKNYKTLVDNGFGMTDLASKSFYAEFSDFDINRCDDWVKENVVGKLIHTAITSESDVSVDNTNFRNDTQMIKRYLGIWLSQFSDYEIQVVVDCGTWDWYWFLQLVAEWEIKNDFFAYMEDLCAMPLQIQLFKYRKLMDKAGGRHVSQVRHNVVPTVEQDGGKFFITGDKTPICVHTKNGLPKLPENISPVPLDLNDLIAFKKGVSVKEAFDLNREVQAFMNAGDGVSKNGESFSKHCNMVVEYPSGKILQEGMIKHNSLWDAKVIKAIYNKLINQ